MKFVYHTYHAPQTIPRNPLGTNYKQQTGNGNAVIIGWLQP